MIRRVSSGVSNHVTVQRQKIRKGIKNWHKSVILFFLLIVYLVMGALIFCAIEGETQLEAQRSLNDFSNKFLADHSHCLNDSDLRDYVNLILEAIDNGAVLNKDFKTPANEDGTLKELWNLPNAFFFSSTVVTTIGYGNLAPRTPLGRILCICYALIGIPMTGWMLSSIGQTFQDKWASVGRVIRKLTHRTKSDSVNNVVHILFVFFLAYSTIIIVPAVVISHAEDWYYIDAHYFCFISLTTIGFGDLAPVAWTEADNKLGQWIYTVLYVTYLLLGLSILSVALTSFLATHRSQIRSARQRVKKFVKDSARHATVRMMEATERRASQDDTLDSSFKKRSGKEADLPDEDNLPRLLKVTPRATSVEDGNPKNLTWSQHESDLKSNQGVSQLPPWMLSNVEEEKDTDHNSIIGKDRLIPNNITEKNRHVHSDDPNAVTAEIPGEKLSALPMEENNLNNSASPDDLHEYDIINPSDLDRDHKENEDV